MQNRLNQIIVDISATKHYLGLLITFVELLVVCSPLNSGDNAKDVCGCGYKKVNQIITRTLTLSCEEAARADDALRGLFKAKSLDTAHALSLSAIDS